MICLQSVAEVHARLFPVLPLMPGRKVPATRRGLHSASQDLERISSWWRLAPSANVGVRTGNGVLGLDLDSKATTSGFMELSAYAHASGIEGSEWLDTYTVLTPSGGLHLYYETSLEVGNRVGVLPGVDVRGEDGYLVSAHSRIKDRAYLPESGYSEELSVGLDGSLTLQALAPVLAPAPEWLLELVLKPKSAAAVAVFPAVVDRASVGSDPLVRDLPSYLEAVLLGERDRLLSAKAGTRNNTLNYSAYRLGRHVGAGRLDFDQAEAWLVGTASHMGKGEDGSLLTEAEVRATVRSGLRGGMAHE